PARDHRLIATGGGAGSLKPDATVSTVTAAILLCLTAATADAAISMRGVWINHYAIRPQVRPRTLEHVVQAGFNTVFLRAPTIENRHGRNVGASDPADFIAFLKLANQRGLPVHGWITNKMRSGKPQADFTDPKEQRAQADWASDLLTRYPRLSGVHLDYIRYSKWEKPDAERIAAVTATVADIRRTLRQHHRGAFLTAAVFPAHYSYLGGRWGPNKKAQWEGDVPAWYRSWFVNTADNFYIHQPTTDAAAKRFPEHNPVHLYGPSFFHYQQDPVAWLRADLVDGVMPMQYAADDWIWQAEVNAWKQIAPRHVQRVYPGLGWLEEKGQPRWRRDADALLRHVRFAEKHRLRGVCLFTLGVDGVDDGPLVRALSDDGGPFATGLRSPLRRQPTPP
ncbi:MAG: hypothetical protein OER86_06805, partial [Phycisphaerae bacterium]|nr:hypothetical protein [Phycisphaerae bacterium]